MWESLSLYYSKFIGQQNLKNGTEENGLKLDCDEVNILHNYSKLREINVFNY